MKTAYIELKPSVLIDSGSFEQVEVKEGEDKVWCQRLYRWLDIDKQTTGRIYADTEQNIKLMKEITAIEFALKHATSGALRMIYIDKRRFIREQLEHYQET